jgi:hypothetical protein
MYDQVGDDGRRKYTVAEIAGTFGVSRKTVYRHLEPSGGRRQSGKSARPVAPAGLRSSPPGGQSKPLVASQARELARDLMERRVMPGRKSEP